MKRALFILLTLLIFGLFLFTPKFTGRAVSDDCFLKDNPDVIIDTKETKFIYDGIYISAWSFDSIGNLKIKTIDNNQVKEKNMQTIRYLSSTDDCEFHTFNFKRQAQVLDFNLAFDRIEEGQCVYKTDEMVETLEISLYGSLIRKVVSYDELVPLKEICDETDAADALPPNCPQIANCKIFVPEGDEMLFAFEIEKDECGNVIAKESNDGERIYSDEIDSRASEFIQSCEARRLTEKESLRRKSEECANYDTQQTCTTNDNCQWQAQQTKPIIGCVSSPLREAGVCVARTCASLSETLLPRNPEKVLNFVLEGLTNELNVKVEKTDSEFKFKKPSGNEYFTETLAEGDSCKFVRGYFVRKDESYDYPLKLISEIPSDDLTLCTYDYDSNLWNLLSLEQQYIYKNGVSQNNCPTGQTSEVPKGTSCSLSWPTCTKVSKSDKVFNVLLAEYCGGWDARATLSSENAQTEVQECDERVREAIEGQEPECGNGRVEIWEECDGNNFGSYGDGVDKCKIFNSNKYVSGNLRCFPKGHEKQCKIDVSECKECTAKENLGYIIGEGGIKNRLLGASRGRMWGKLDLFFVRYDKNNVGLEADMTTKIWVHKDAYGAKYETYIKYNPSKDKFNLAEFFPSKDYGKHFIIILTTKIKDRDITLKSQYVPYGNSPPADLAGFVISNPEKTMEKRVDIKREEVFTLITENLFKKIVGFFVSGNRGDILFPGEYGKFQNTVTTWPKQPDLTWLSEDHLKSDNEKYPEFLEKFLKPFQNLLRKIMQDKEANTKCN